jgi:hypothetical protein
MTQQIRSPMLQTTLEIPPEQVQQNNSMNITPTPQDNNSAILPILIIISLNNKFKYYIMELKYIKFKNCKNIIII